jgi:hypothetical protein
MKLRELLIILQNQDPDLHMYHAKGKFPMEVNERVGVVFCFPTTAKIGDVIHGIKKVMTPELYSMPVCMIRKLKVH